MEIEEVAEEYVRLVVDEKLRQAQTLVAKESEDREDELADWMRTIGIEYGENGNHFVALQCFETAEKIVRLESIREEILQYLVIAHNNYANLLFDVNRFEEAEKHYKEALRINPEYAEAHSNYAFLLFDVNRFEEAEKHYKEALRIDPEIAIVHSNYALLLCDVNRFEEAEKHYKEALRINPEYTFVHNNYANLLCDVNRFEEAEKHYKEALRINPEYAEASANVGILYLRTNRLDSAHDWLGNAKSIFEEEGRDFESRHVEAYTDWITARKFWESFSFSKEDTHPNLEKSQEYYLRAATKLKEINLLQPAFFLEFISDAIFISKEYLLSLDSKTLIEMRTTMSKIHENFLPLYKEIRQVSFPDIDLLKAQFICIDTLKKCLNFEDVNIAELHEATDIFSNYNFKEPLQATTALENFTNEFKELRKHYKTVEEIPKEKKEELLQMVKPFSVYDSVITKKMDKLASDKFVTPYTELEAIREEVSQVRKELPLIIREEVSPIVKESEAKIISEFIAGFDKYYHELVQELEALTSAQLSKVKEVISRVIEEEIDKVEDQKKKETLWNKKKAYDIARDVISILESVVSIYSVLRTNPEQAVNDAATLISTILSTIREK